MFTQIKSTVSCTKNHYFQQGEEGPVGGVGGGLNTITVLTHPHHHPSQRVPH